jgi:hypothetical protein
MLVSPHRLMSRTPAPLPTLRLSLLSGSLDSRITFSRASAAWTYDGTTLTSYGTDVARITAASGLLVEEARTNLFLNSAVGVTQSCTVTAAAHTLSFYGTGTVTLSGVSTAGPLVGTGATDRVSLTFTPTAGSLTLTVSGSVRYVNLELGSFATSAIVTAGSTVLRAVDVATVNTLTPWFNAAEGTLLVEFTPTRAAAGTTQYPAGFDDGTVANIISVYFDATGQSFGFVSTASVQQVNSYSGVNLSNGVTAKLAFAYKLNDFAVSANGAAAVTDVLGTIPTVTKLVIGNRSAGSRQYTGHIRRILYWPTRRSNAALRTI